MPNSQLTRSQGSNGQANCENNDKQSKGSEQNQNKVADANLNSQTYHTPGEDAKYWQSRYDKLLSDYNHLQNINQNLEEKLLNVVETFEKKREELVANIEYEKTTLMADVNKLSTKLVDARIKLHDYEEKEMIHATECNSPCHRNCQNSVNKANNGTYDQAYDPNLV